MGQQTEHSEEKQLDKKALNQINFPVTLMGLKSICLRKTGFLEMLKSAVQAMPYPMIYVNNVNQLFANVYFDFSIVKDDEIRASFTQQYTQEKGLFEDEKIESSCDIIEVLVNKQSAFAFLYALPDEVINSIEYVIFADSYIVTLNLL